MSFERADIDSKIKEIEEEAKYYFTIFEKVKERAKKLDLKDSDLKEISTTIYITLGRKKRF
jgi:hypothetical protein